MSAYLILYIYELEHGKIAVGTRNLPERYERDFNDITKAVDFFLKLREELELGFDFERALMKK